MNVSQCRPGVSVRRDVSSLRIVIEIGVVFASLPRFIHCFEVLGPVVKDVIWLITEELSDEVVEDIGELRWDVVFLHVLGRHL